SRVGAETTRSAGGSETMSSTATTGYGAVAVTTSCSAAPGTNRIWGGDGVDTIQSVGLDAIDGGPGSDVINAAYDNADDIRCDPGDVVTADATDRVGGGCEVRQLEIPSCCALPM